MTIFVLISFGVPLCVYFLLPEALEKITGKPKTSRLPLLIGGSLFFVSWYLPSPLIQGEFTAFNTHFVGGGIFTGFLWYYLKNHLGWKSTVIFELITLYALVSSLGVANELWELWVSQFTSIKINALDTWWDMLANTLGAFTFWVLYYIYTKLSKN